MDTAYLIVTAHPEFVQAAVQELRRFESRLTAKTELAPGIVLCEVPDATQLMRRAAREHPVFARHLAPVQATIQLSGNQQDIGAIAVALAQLPELAMLERGSHFAVQTRIVQTSKKRGERPYSSGQLNQSLAEVLAEETGAVEDIKWPRIVVSLLGTTDTCYLGISPVEENLSNWPGGARHYAQTPEQISRAEFKLLEGLEAFGLELPTQGRALDLGAAPGGWTRLLLDTGLAVTAVDPANLDPRLAKQRLEHYRGYAENYLEEAITRRLRFDVIVNDMRMDAREAARLLVRADRTLHEDGFVLSVFKLPHATEEVDPLVNFREALHTLRQRYSVVQARQLFHNRQEVTVVAAQPLPMRRR